MTSAEAPSTNLRLCLKLVAGALRVDAKARQEVLAACGAIAQSALASDTPRDDIELVATMLRMGCDATVSLAVRLPSRI